MAIYFDLSDILLERSGEHSDDVLSGYAYLPEKGEPVLGRDAITFAKIHPTRINNRYWTDLNTDATAPAHDKIRHNADLAWYSLKALCGETADTQAVFLVPSSYRQDELNLLAGICKSLEFNSVAFVNRSIASALCHPEITTQNKLVHIELQLHQTLLTHINNVDGLLSVHHYETLPGMGLARLQDSWLHLLRQRFIASSRFDPMHSGETEQQLFDQIQDLACTDSNITYDFSVKTEDQTLLESVSQDELSKVSDDIFSAIYAKISDQVLLFDRHFQSLPGEALVSHFAVQQTDMLFASAKRMLEAASESDSDFVHIVDTPIAGTKVAPVPGGAKDIVQTSDHSASHVLLNGCAYPAANYEIVSNGVDIALKKTTKPDLAHLINESGHVQLGDRANEILVNGQPGASNMPVMQNDKLSLLDDANELVAISVIS